jgi:serine/threonine protein kinase
MTASPRTFGSSYTPETVEASWSRREAGGTTALWPTTAPSAATTGVAESYSINTWTHFRRESLKNTLDSCIRSMPMPSSPSENFRVGDHVGRYKITHRPGVQRGLATVVVAWDTELRRRVTLKLSPSDQCGPLENEARTLADVSHSNILAVYDIGQHLDYRYAAFEYVGRSLETEIEQPTFAAPKLVDVIAKVASTLDHVHRRGYLHCNVSPQSIRLDDSGQPRLSGFQVRVDRSHEDAAVGGTPRYMAPEQVRSDRTGLGPWTDVWGLGITLYIGLTGRSPFDGRTIQETFTNILHKDPVALREVNPSIPAALEATCMRCLEKQPSLRFAGADELAVALRGADDKGTLSTPQRVFVSHSSKDRRVVEDDIVFPLEANGISTWYSKVSIQTAAEWERSILEGLKSCGWFLIAMSTNSASSEWVRDELHWAIENRPARILPMLLEDCEPREFHIRLARLQAIDLRDRRGAQKQLIETIVRSLAARTS